MQMFWCHTDGRHEETSLKIKAVSLAFISKGHWKYYYCWNSDSIHKGKILVTLGNTACDLLSNKTEFTVYLFWNNMVLVQYVGFLLYEFMKLQNFILIKYLLSYFSLKPLNGLPDHLCYP